MVEGLRPFANPLVALPVARQLESADLSLGDS
jgi:hypothetical protein